MEKRSFKCFECNHVWEVEFGIPRPEECPKCKSENLHRVKQGDNNFNRQRRRQRERSNERSSE